jgi:hypothetical protein
MRVRNTSCGYVASEATILEKAEHARIAVGVSCRPSRPAVSFEFVRNGVRRITERPESEEDQKALTCPRLALFIQPELDGDV